jgi:hypothetical protein
MDVDIVSDINAGELDGGSVAAPSGAPGAVPVHGEDAVTPNKLPAGKPADEPNSLRDQLTAAFKGKAGEPTSQDQAATAGQPRGPDGKFAPKTAEEQAAAAAQPGTEQPAAAADGTLQPLQAPSYMQQGDAEQFAKLPVEMQHFVARNMAFAEEAAARFAGYEGVERVIGPRREAWAVNGMDEGRALNQLFAISDFATRAPLDFIKWFAGTQQIDLATVGEGGEPEDDLDPAVADLRRQVQDLTGRLSAITDGQATATHQNIVETVAQWGSEKGTDGNLMRPYFAELGRGILPYIQQVKAENPNATHPQVLAEAYERACWGTPAVRAKLIAAQDAVRLAEARKDAARAKGAAVSVDSEAPGPGATVPKNESKGSVRDDLRAAFQQHSV